VYLIITPFGRFGCIHDTRMLLDVTVSAFTLSGGPGTAMDDMLKLKIRDLLQLAAARLPRLTVLLGQTINRI